MLMIVVFSLSSFTVSAVEYDGQEAGRSQAKSYLSVTGIKNRTLSTYPDLTVYFNGRREGYKGRLIADTVYIPIKKFVESSTAASAVYNSQSKIFTVSGLGYKISVSDGAYVFYASDRPIFSVMPSVVLSDGEMYVPLSAVTQAFGLYSSVSPSTSAVHISGTPAPLISASKFYREDEVYWLARIINAESRGEPLIGQIAVGNVVLNRVSSSLYPNTIWGVIFDKKYGVQFSPIIDGSIYGEPTYTSVLAAKICLEGFSLSDDALFFLYPVASTSSWIPRNREYAFSIGKHDFYR